MHMVSPDLDLVDCELRAGRLSCPLCEGRLRPWGVGAATAGPASGPVEAAASASVPMRGLRGDARVDAGGVPAAPGGRGRGDRCWRCSRRRRARGTGRSPRGWVGRLRRCVTWLRRFAARAGDCGRCSRRWRCGWTRGLTRRLRRGRWSPTRWPRWGRRRRRRTRRVGPRRAVAAGGGGDVGPAAVARFDQHEFALGGVGLNRTASTSVPFR